MSRGSLDRPFLLLLRLGSTGPFLSGVTGTQMQSGNLSPTHGTIPYGVEEERWWQGANGARGGMVATSS